MIVFNLQLKHRGNRCKNIAVAAILENIAVATISENFVVAPNSEILPWHEIIAPRLVP